MYHSRIDCRTEGALAEKPLIAITQGDPCGIGPEVVARALGGGRPYAVARPVVIGCVESMEAGARVAAIDRKVRRITSLDGVGMDPGVLDVLDEGQPIEARPPSLSYVVKKLAARHKIAFASVTGSVVFIVFAMSVAIWASPVASRAPRGFASSRCS